MMSSEAREILFELAMSIDPQHSTRNLLANCVPLFIRRLGCAAGAVFDMETGHPVRLFAVPRVLEPDLGMIDALSDCRDRASVASLDAASETASETASDAETEPEMTLTTYVDRHGRTGYIWHFSCDMALVLLRQRPFEESFALDLSSVVVRLGQALEQIGDRRKLKARHKFQVLLTGISAELVQVSSTDVDSVVEHALETLGGFVGADRSLIFQWPNNDGTTNCTHEWCAPGVMPHKETLQALPQESLPQWKGKLEHLECAYIPRVDELTHRAQAGSGGADVEDAKSLLLLPEADHGRLTFLLVLSWSRSATDFDRDMIPLVQLAGDIMSDALSRAKAAAELHESVERTHLALNGADLGMWDWHIPTGRVVFNERWAEMFGYALDEIAPNLSTWEKLVHSDDMPGVEDVLTAHLEGKTDYYETEHRVRHKCGDWIWVLDRGRVTERDVDGNPIRACGTHLDITERKKSDGAIRRALDGVVNVIGLTVEYRDPYTAGHQRRVADLARAIALKMELPEVTVKAIHVAGVIHDLGKVAVPSEILTKPGKLTEKEFSLIMEHPQVGFDIIKDLEFPWDVAHIVLQHHERLDGSGYPRGLKMDEILLEARILTVADVVEAMATHRPYRPSLGLEEALAEILRERGTFYDPDVVDACIRLFHSEEYSLADV